MADRHAGGCRAVRGLVLGLWALAGIASGIRQVAAGILWVAMLQGIASAQGQTAQFEVASIREIVDGVQMPGEFKPSGRRAEYHRLGIPALIAEAWKVRPDDVALAPGVSPSTVYPMVAVGRSARIYDIVASAPEGTAPTRDEFRLMLQALLASRFKLAAHTEKRDKPVYVLETDGTPKLKASSGDGPCRSTASRTPQGQHIVATHCPIQNLINVLFVDRPIYDETGLTGFYDFEITAALPFQALAGQVVRREDDPQAITPFSAVKEFGLKLEAKRLQVDTIVIDHVEAPGEN